MKNIKGIKGIVKVAPFVFSACPIWYTCACLLDIVHGMSWGINTIATQMFFDAVEKGIQGLTTYNTVILIGLLMGAAIILSQVLNGAANLISEGASVKIMGILTKRLYKKVTHLDPIVYENPEFLDDINKAEQGLGNASWAVQVCVMIFTFYLPYFLVMGTYLYQLQPKLAFSLVLIFIPVAIGQFFKTTIFAELEDEVAPIRRESTYYEDCIGDRTYFKETRLLGSFRFFEELYKASNLLLSQKIWKAKCKTAKMEFTTSVLTLAGYCGVLYLLIEALLQGTISVGAFAAVFSSIEMMFSLMEEVICRHIGNVTQGLGTINNLVRFLDLPERSGDDRPIDMEQGIQFHEVGFTYPGAKESSLQNINLHINGGETIAIVGENGAGKTTIVKLIMGMYLPTEGSVVVGGQDTTKVKPNVLFEKMSAVMQKFQKYKLTLKDNIYLSDVHAYEEQYKEERLETALSQADLNTIDRGLPNGYDTVLSREFDGVDLSGGQWQRVAIARGLFRKHDMIVLDEPTAAIDPIEETKIYNKFIEITKGKTAIIVTHRIGSAQIADRIIVMDKGQVAEVGTHEELISQEGKYKEMYEAQAKWYA